MEQTVKDLQAQNAQFQQMLLAMGKGQEDLTTLLLKDKKKKSKKATSILNLRRRPKTLDLSTPPSIGASLEEDHNLETEEAGVLTKTLLINITCVSFLFETNLNF